MRIIVILVLAFSIIIPEYCFGCLWDYDTLAMERQQFPQTQELIVGNFLRHSDAYYEWRIADRSAKNPANRTPGDYDDLAVAYDKLGQHDKAIETVRAKIKRWPNEGRYESEANLGTFLIHADRFEEGLPHINKAIEINSEAHFGREVYQKLLVEYVIEQRVNRTHLPLNDKMDGKIGFTLFILKKHPVNEKDNEIKQKKEMEEIQKAVKGIMGMMRFGNYRSPVLLEALGDLLLADGYRNGTRMLAARAYLKAAYEVDDPQIATAYRNKATVAISIQYERSLKDIEPHLKSEIAQGNEFFAQVAVDEKLWAATGKNLDQEYARKYYEDPALELKEPNWAPRSPNEMIQIILWSLAGSVLVMVLVSIWFIRRLYRNSNLPKKMP